MAVTSYPQLEAAIRNWAENEPSVQVIMVVGSRAYNDRADRFSDLDLILFTTRSDLLTNDSFWLGDMSEIWAAYLNKTGRGDPEWIVLFAGGLKADFALIECKPVDTHEQSWQMLVSKSPYRFVLERGARLLYTRSDPHLQTRYKMKSSSRVVRGLPDEKGFRQLSSQAYLLLYQSIKMAQRGDTWLSQAALQGDFRRLLIRFLEWQALSDKQQEVWFGGRNLSTWADPRFLADIEVGFSLAFQDPLNAIPPILTSFHALASITSQNLGFNFPTQADLETQSWLAELCQA